MLAAQGAIQTSLDGIEVPAFLSSVRTVLYAMVGDVFIADPRQGEVYEEVLQADGGYRQSLLVSELAEPQGIALNSGGSIYITTSNGNLYREAPRQDGSWRFIGWEPLAFYAGVGTLQRSGKSCASGYAL